MCYLRLLTVNEGGNLLCALLQRSPAIGGIGGQQTEKTPSGNDKPNSSSRGNAVAMVTAAEAAEVALPPDEHRCGGSGREMSAEENPVSVELRVQHVLSEVAMWWAFCKQVVPHV